MARWRDVPEDPEAAAVEAAALVVGWHPGDEPELRELALELASA